MDNAVKESNSMMKTILAGLSMTIDQNDDLIPAPMETEDVTGDGAKTEKPNLQKEDGKCFC